MFAFIVMTIVVLVAGLAYCKLGGFIENVVKGAADRSASGAERVINAAATGAAKGAAWAYNGLPSFVASMAATSAAFVVLAVGVGLVNPPQGEFTTENVDWNTRQSTLLGSVSDAVLVRTTGAAVESGVLYSTARLSGQEYVSLFGSPWFATDNAQGVAMFSYCVLALMGIVAGLVVGYLVIPAYSRVQAAVVTRVAPAAALTL